MRQYLTHIATVAGALLISVQATEDGVDLIKLVPTKEEMEKLMRTHGVNDGDAVVIAMKGAGSKDVTFGTRLYWQMKYWGHDNVAILDGGTAAWAAAGHPLSRDKSKPRKGNWVAKGPDTSILATTADVEKAVKNGTQLIDGRTEDFYLGSTYNKGIDPEAPSITYCDSGHLSSGHWFVLHELLGNKQARLYDGSMHEWTKRKEPVEGLPLRHVHRGDHRPGPDVRRRRDESFQRRLGGPRL